MNDNSLLDWAEFVATKFGDDVAGWVYSRDLTGLKHIRYESDYTGYNHWKKRLHRALRAWNPVRYFKPKADIDKMFDEPNKSLKSFLLRAAIWSWIAIRKDNNLPDGQINGIITHWEENGEYIAMFQPRVGVKVIEFIRANPDNEYAKAIMAEMQACVELSWPSDEKEEK